MAVRQRRMAIQVCCLVLAIGLGHYFYFFPSELVRAVSSKRGFILKKYTDPYGHWHNYAVFVPYDYQPGQKRPLLLFLNGLGENGTDGFTAIGNNFGIQVWEMKRRFPFVVAIPQCEPGKSWMREETQKAMAILDQVAHDYGTDPDRVCVTGVSAGGGGAWYIANEYPDRFAAMAPICGGPVADAEKLAQARLPIWSLYNAGDAAGLVQSNRDMYQKLLEAGASPMVTEFPWAGHDAWNAGYRTSGLFEWFLEQRRSKNAHAKMYTLLSSEKLLAEWKARGPFRWTKLGDYTLGVESGKGKPPGFLISNKDYPACEFHVEMWLPNEGDACQLALIDASTTPMGESTKGYTLHLPFVSQGSGGLTHSTDGWVAKLDPAAQRQFRIGYWNDVRLHFGENRITVRVNGWKAIDVRVPLAGKRFHVALVAANNPTGIQWRNVRLCEPD